MHSNYEGSIFLLWRKNPGEEPTVLQAWESEDEARAQIMYLRDHRHPSIAFYLERVSLFRKAIFDDWDPYQVDTVNL